MRLVIYGSKEFSNTVAELAKHCGHEVVGFVDDYYVGPNILGTLSDVSTTYPPKKYGIAMAIGYSDLQARWSAWKRVKEIGYHAPALIHSRAYVADSAKIGEGVMVMAGAIVDVRAVIGTLSVLWPGSCVNHDVQIGLNTFISPGVVVCGYAKIGSHSFIGAGSVIVDHGNVPESSFIRMLTRYTCRSDEKGSNPAI